MEADTKPNNSLANAAWRFHSRFAVRVLTDATTVDWRLHGAHGEVSYHTLHLRAPRSPGVYRLYVEAAGHAAKALVVVA